MGCRKMIELRIVWSPLESPAWDKLKSSNLQASILNTGTWEVRLVNYEFISVWGSLHKYSSILQSNFQFKDDHLCLTAVICLLIHISHAYDEHWISGWGFAHDVGVQCISRYEGDLVAKCYCAKHKRGWEVLDGGLKKQDQNSCKWGSDEGKSCTAFLDLLRLKYELWSQLWSSFFSESIHSLMSCWNEILNKKTLVLENLVMDFTILRHPPAIGFCQRVCKWRCGKSSNQICKQAWDSPTY
jgi:hypothetical protein